MKKLPCVLVLSLGLSLVSPISPLSGGNKAKNIPVTTAKPQENKVYPIAIIGAGAGGSMAVKRAVLNNREVLLFTGAKKEMKNSRGNWVRQVDNVPGLAGYDRTIVELRNETLQEIVKGPLAHNLYLIPESVKALKKEGNLFRLNDSAGNSYLAHYVILATGMMDVQPHIQGSIKPILSYANNQSVAYCLVCDGHRSYKKNSAVIGYSEDAAHSAMLLMDRYHPPSVTILANGNALQMSDATRAILKSKKIQIEEEPIKKILGNKKQLSGFQLESGKEVKADIGFVSLGIRPNNKLAKQLGAKLDDRGLVVADSSGESSIPNLFVVGDIRANSTKQIYTAWQHAVEAVQIIDRRIRNEKSE